ncbi:MerR family transcriptional regulator [Sphaerisporangium sp. TRM90804]|uniref:MerR family transcriptional regulator n=1 Tax=Sphaerisporangium sp. TRM90804 TaxID=3031113 RepID=UPI00244A2864|nr:MerR family transcriptional regulator [Sphaerisporangium sp. TRM90804]MDH2428078.1 MerR family transcriptional regulator [Sphaerisporangium sp. TRM90804]
MDDHSEVTAGESGDPGDDGPSYGIGAVARRLGVPAPTLRTWNLRYGIGPSRRSPGGHRRYDAADLVRLETMNRLIKAGLPPAEAAQAALNTRGAAAPLPEVGAGTPARVASSAVLARAALNLDAVAVVEHLDAALAAHGVAWTWERLALPVLDAICRRQETTGAGVEIEHLFSERLLSALSRLTGRPADPAHPRPVLLACAEDDQHSLPVYALAATLTSAHRLETRVLGPRTPYSALGDAMRRLGPVAVFVWSQLEATGDPAPLQRLPVLRPASRIVLGGPGWGDRRPPAGVARAHSLADAVTQVLAALG